MSLLQGIDRGAGGSASATSTGTFVYADGVPETPAGFLLTTATTGAPAAGSTVRWGVCFAADGTIRTTTDAIGLVDKGVAYTAARVLCITANAPNFNSRYAYVPHIGLLLVDSTGRVHVS